MQRVGQFFALRTVRRPWGNGQEGNIMGTGEGKIDREEEEGREREHGMGFKCSGSDLRI